MSGPDALTHSMPLIPESATFARNSSKGSSWVLFFGRRVNDFGFPKSSKKRLRKERKTAVGMSCIVKGALRCSDAVRQVFNHIAQIYLGLDRWLRGLHLAAAGHPASDLCCRPPSPLVQLPPQRRCLQLNRPGSQVGGEAHDCREWSLRLSREYRAVLQGRREHPCSSLAR